jgi:hypothetical protein
MTETAFQYWLWLFWRLQYCDFFVLSMTFLYLLWLLCTYCDFSVLIQLLWLFFSCTYCDFSGAVFPEPGSPAFPECVPLPLVAVLVVHSGGSWMVSSWLLEFLQSGQRASLEWMEFLQSDQRVSLEWMESLKSGQQASLEWKESLRGWLSSLILGYRESEIHPSVKKFKCHYF